MLDPLTFTTEVPCSQEKAFSIFVNEMAEMMRGGYNSGWVIIFEEAYSSACSG